jgi:hypothetical protein
MEGRGVVRRAIANLAVVTSLSLAACARSTDPPAGKVIVDLAAGPANSFTPDQAFGAVIDGLAEGRVRQVYTTRNINDIRRAGLRSTAYTLRTELAIEAWHWSQEGRWSDPARRQGYWTGSDHPRHPALTGWGYILPRRGDSIDQANDDGYSRLDDGDPATFWKSNPYLDTPYTHRPARPQWVVVSLAALTPIDAARIRWAKPFARTYEVQYWTGIDEYDREGRWVDFPQGRVANGRGGDVLLRLSAQPRRVRYLRVLLETSSHAAPPGSTDRRDALGYAIGEIGFGVIDPSGRFKDVVRHTPNGADQTNVYVSSTDPWHRAVDRDPDVEQPGFDRVFHSGLTNGLPVMLTVGPLYDTPENTAAELRFMKRRGYPLGTVEIGLEPDGQNISPEDFAALYAQTAAAVRAVDPEVRLAGPGLQDAVSDTWLDDTRDHSWTRRFVRAADTLGSPADIGAFTFEHYGYDVLCGAMDRKLLAEDGAMTSDLARLKSDGVPTGIPWMIIEYGMSAFSAQGLVELPGALFDADMIGRFLTLGGHGAYMLGYEPDQLYPPDNTCAGYGELMLFGQDAHGAATWPTPAFWSAFLLSREWAQPGAGQHDLYRAAWVPASASPGWVVAYPVRRPDGRLAVLLINRDPSHAHPVQIDVRRRALGLTSGLPGPFDVIQYGRDQYVWAPDGAAGHPTRDQPPRRFRLDRQPLTLPPYSLTVVRTAGPIDQSSAWGETVKASMRP